MYNIGFVGNCQTVALCYYLQKLTDNNSNYNVNWCSYSDLFLGHLNTWSDKCNNKIYNAEEGIAYLKTCDFIFYQKIKPETSTHFHTELIHTYGNSNCKFFSLSSIHIDLDNFDNSLKYLKEHDMEQKNYLKCSEIIENNRHQDLLLTSNHPTTFFFMEIMKHITWFLQISFFDDSQYKSFITDRNYMQLP